MDILEGIKQFINDSIKPLFVSQKEDFSRIINNAVSYVVSELKRECQANTQDVASILLKIQRLNQDLQNLQTQLAAIQSSINQRKEPLAEIKVINSGSSTPIAESQASVFYAKYVDSLNPLGFNIANLKEEEDGCAFKITLSDGTNGCYQFIDDKEIQQEILAAFNPLISDSSVYDFVPFDATQIIVIDPGTVIKDDKILKITNKQKIKFS